MNKKSTLLQGKFLLPLVMGKRAVIAYNDQTISTSTVIAIYELSEERVVFETRNTVYCVIPMCSDIFTSYIPLSIEACR